MTMTVTMTVIMTMTMTMAIKLNMAVNLIMLVRMTCMYEPDDLTETRMELLAAVSTDSDLYLAKVLTSTTFDLYIWSQLHVLV